MASGSVKTHLIYQTERKKKSVTYNEHGPCILPQVSDASGVIERHSQVNY